MQNELEGGGLGQDSPLKIVWARVFNKSEWYFMLIKQHFLKLFEKPWLENIYNMEGGGGGE